MIDAIVDTLHGPNFIFLREKLNLNHFPFKIDLCILVINFSFLISYDKKISHLVSCALSFFLTNYSPFKLFFAYVL